MSDYEDLDFSADRDAAIQWARRVIESGTAVILDTETTGLTFADEIIEIAVIDTHGQTLYQSRVKPTVPISDGAFAVHGITAESLADMPGFAEVYNAIAPILQGNLVITYNADFDRRMIRQSLAACDCAGMARIVFDCAMLEYAAFVGEFDFRRGSYRWQKLQGGDHSAVGDCQATLALIINMAYTKLSTEAA